MRFTIHVLTIALLTVLISVQSTAAQTSSPTSARDVWRNFAKRVDLGTELNVQLSDGHRVQATLVGVEDDAVLLQPKTRIAVPVQAVRYDDIVRMEPRKGGHGTGKAVAIGVATGVGTFFGIMLLLLAAVGD
jgi:hypothetical protein